MPSVVGCVMQLAVSYVSAVVCRLWMGLHGYGGRQLSVMIRCQTCLVVSSQSHEVLGMLRAKASCEYEDWWELRGHVANLGG